MSFKPIITHEDYKQALTRLEIIFDATRGSKEGDELEVLGMLIDKYENESIPTKSFEESIPKNNGKK